MTWYAFGIDLVRLGMYALLVVPLVVCFVRLRNEP